MKRTYTKTIHATGYGHADDRLKWLADSIAYDKRDLIHKAQIVPRKRPSEGFTNRVRVTVTITVEEV